ncbi:hypothetical protein BD560DRAFT_413379 [Blakeslea trispora]|nr:hypothetical protein BD560DRAFT_413379 [Blakeslea trispora]
MIFKDTRQSVDEHYTHYDIEIASAVTKADNEDGWQNRSENGSSVDQIQEEEKYESQSDSLLHLILGVQHYLEEQRALNSVTYDSPLCRLEYRMHIYIREKTSTYKPFS